MVLCPNCNKCSKCCTKTSCRGSPSKFLESLAKARGRSEGDPDLKRGLYSPLSDPTETLKAPHGHKLLCQSLQEQLPVRGITATHRQKCSRASKKSHVPGFLQPTVSSSQTEQQMETHSGPEQTKSFSKGTKVQDGDTRDHKNLPARGRMGYLHRLQGRLLPHSHTRTVQKIPKVSCGRSNLPIQSTSLWPFHSSHGVHCCCQRSKTDGFAEGYKNPPVPRRLVGESQIPPSLSPGYPDLSKPLPATRLGSKHGKISVGTITNFRLCRLPIRPGGRSGATDTGPVETSPRKTKLSSPNPILYGQTVHVTDRPADGHGKTGSSGRLHEANSMSSQEQLESTGFLGRNHTATRIPAPPPPMVVGGGKCPPGATFTPRKICSSDVYRRIKRRLGRSLKRAHGKGFLVASRKRHAHKLPRVQSGFPGSARLSRTLFQPDRSGSNQQHYSSVIHKQGRGDEVGPAMRSAMENPDLVFQSPCNSLSPTHPRPTKCGLRQAFDTRTDHSN